MSLSAAGLKTAILSTNSLSNYIKTQIQLKFTIPPAGAATLQDFCDALAEGIADPVSKAVIDYLVANTTVSIAGVTLQAPGVQTGVSTVTVTKTGTGTIS